MENSQKKKGDSSSLAVASINCQGQTRMNESKQRMIQFEIQSKQLDIVHLQECQIDSDTFQCCEFISQNFQIIKNNADNGYGTACIIRNNIQIEKVKVIPGGRIISFNVGKTTFINIEWLLYLIVDAVLMLFIHHNIQTKSIKNEEL